MGERIVYLNGQFLPASEAKISVFDRGFFWGDAIGLDIVAQAERNARA